METTDKPNATQAPVTSDIEASIAAARRVEHLSALVRTRLTDADALDPVALARAVVRALYEEHPSIRLDDALELVHLVETPPADTSTKTAIKLVVTDACAHLDEWNRFAPRVGVNPSSEPESEDHGTITGN